MSLELTVACDRFELTRGLRDGSVAIDGVAMQFLPEMTNAVRHAAMVDRLAFDVCELNLFTYLIAKQAGIAITAIPVFLFRKFRHGSIYVATRSGIEHPRQLQGARIACPTVQAASNIWIGGILNDSFGLRQRSIEWITEREERGLFAGPGDLKIRPTPGRRGIDLLRAGEVDALSTPQTPKSIISGDSGVRRLFPDYCARERTYFDETGIFPIMHVTAIRQRLVDEHPWLPKRLQAAFESSKLLCYERAAGDRTFPLAWLEAAWVDQTKVLGRDPWEFGLTPSNRNNLSTAMRYAVEHGLIEKIPDFADLFAAVV
ncbi:hypothetical protein [Beijerinckia sp. L45]|uniref:hypothetical protein n=1 Tax=Beijerinckia sp. L45 TaxID=1641855 RepID=UPI00131CF4DF|nr:hypothetical protein [Beijerinckia sp. L45]